MKGLSHFHTPNEMFTAHDNSLTANLALVKRQVHLMTCYKVKCQVLLHPIVNNITLISLTNQFLICVVTFFPCRYHQSWQWATPFGINFSFSHLAFISKDMKQPIQISPPAGIWYRDGEYVQIPGQLGAFSSVTEQQGVSTFGRSRVCFGLRRCTNF